MQTIAVSVPSDFMNGHPSKGTEVWTYLSNASIVKRGMRTYKKVMFIWDMAVY